MIDLPGDFKEFIQKKLGSAFPEFLESLEQESPTSMRLNPAKAPLTQSDQQVPWCASGRYLVSRPMFTLDPLLHAGTFYVQEASSMFLEQVLQQSVDLSKPINVLDLSAAPGGKSTHLATLINRDSLLVSNEVIRSRASILEENLVKWGYPNCVVTNNDPKDFSSLEGFFDVVVVDAPCSGEGLFRKDHDAMKEWSLQNVALCSSRQKRILSDVWPSLKKGGVLVYSTCTFNESENEENLEWFSHQKNVEFISIIADSNWGVETVRKNNVICYQFFPHRVRGEGFFISAIRKTEESAETRTKVKNRFLQPEKKIMNDLRRWIKSPQEKIFLQLNDRIFFVPERKAGELEFLRQNLRIVNAGTSLATVKHDKLIPELAAALSVELNIENFKTIPLDYDNAIKYLKKDALQNDGLPKGFALVTYQNIPLGWVNVLENRINNLYPSEWRIRMSTP